MILTKIRTVADRRCDSSSKEKSVVEVPVICTVLFQREIVVDPELSRPLHHLSNCFAFYTLSNRLFDWLDLPIELFLLVHIIKKIFNWSKSKIKLFDWLELAITLFDWSNLKIKLFHWVFLYIELDFINSNFRAVPKVHR